MAGCFPRKRKTEWEWSCKCGWRYVHMCENMHRTCMHVVCMQMYSLFLLRLKKKLLWLQALYSFERIAEMFDISKPRKHCGTAKRAKLSPWEGTRGPSGAESSLAVHSGQPWLSAFALPPALGAGAVEDAGGRGSGGRRERAQQLQQDPLIKQGNPGSVGQWAAFTGWQLCCGCARAAWQTGFRFWLRKKGAEGGAVVVPSARRAPSPGRCVLATMGAECAHSCLSVSVCVTVCMTVIYLSVWQRNKDARGKSPLENKPREFSLLFPRHPGPL